MSANFTKHLLCHSQWQNYARVIALGGKVGRAGEGVRVNELQHL